MEIRFVLIGLIIFFASFTQGLAGFGFALISIPLLSLVVGIKYAIPLGALCGFVVNIHLSILLRKNIRFKSLKTLIIGSVIAIPFGVFFLSHANPDLLKSILGILVIIFIILTVTQIIKPRPINEKWGYFAGGLSGLLGGAFNTNGPPVLIYFYLKNWDKLTQKAAITGFFLVASCIIVFSHAVTGMTTWDIFKDFIFLLPIIVAGIITGHGLFKKFSTRIYNKIVLGFLFIIGIILIINP